MKIIICEGITEVALVHSLNEKISQTFGVDKLNSIGHIPVNVVEDIHLVNLKGNTNINNVVKTLCKTLVDKEVDKIGFIMDADNNFNAMKDNLNEKIEKLKKAGIDAECNYYILPKNDGTFGMAEDLVMQGLYKQSLMSVITNQVYPIIDSHPEKDIKNPSKTKLMLFGATQDPQSSSASFMLTRASSLIDINNSIFDDLKKFISDIVD